MRRHQLRKPLKIRFAVVPAGLQFIIGLISRHFRGGLKAIVPAGTEFLEAPLRRAAWLVAPALLLAVAGCSRERTPIGRASFDHTYQNWNVVVSHYATPEGVDYTGIAGDREPLMRALAEMRDVGPRMFQSWSERSRGAYLINAHNAHAVRRIVEHWPVGSLEETEMWGSARNEKDIYLLGRHASLKKLTEEVMSDEYSDARALSLLNWAERGCAPLPSFAITELNLADLLERQTRDLMANPRYVEYDVRFPHIHLTPLLDEYEGQILRDFTTSWVFLERYLPDELAERVSYRHPQIHFLDFDHSLNGISPSPVESALGERKRDE